MVSLQTQGHKIRLYFKFQGYKNGTVYWFILIESVLYKNLLLKISFVQHHSEWLPVTVAWCLYVTVPYEIIKWQCQFFSFCYTLKILRTELKRWILGDIWLQMIFRAELKQLSKNKMSITLKYIQTIYFYSIFYKYIFWKCYSPSYKLHLHYN